MSAPESKKQRRRSERAKRKRRRKQRRKRTGGGGVGVVAAAYKRVPLIDSSHDKMRCAPWCVASMQWDVVAGYIWDRYGDTIWPSPRTHRQNIEAKYLAYSRGSLRGWASTLRGSDGEGDTTQGGGAWDQSGHKEEDSRPTTHPRPLRSGMSEVAQVMKRGRQPCARLSKKKRKRGHSRANTQP